MSYKTYNEYKNSNVDWMGDIPIHWQSNRFKIVFSYSKGKNPQTFFDDPGEGLAPYLSMEYLRNDIAPTYVPIKECSLKANNKDILLLWDGSNAGEFVISKEGLVSSTMAKLKPNIKLANNFSKYVCKAIEPTLRELTIGMGVPHVSSFELNNISLPKLPIEEQYQIANYLDRQTAKIDSTIAKNEELIQLLEEKRVALINQVVTKGLNPDVPMKDSGVEWIGKIPEHWECRKINTLSSVSRGASPRPIDDPIYFDDDGEYSWVRISDVTSSNKYLEQTTEKLSTLGKSLSVPIEPGNIFVSIAATVGKPIIANIKCCIHDGFVYFKNLNLNDEYLFYIFAGGEAYKGLGKLGTQLNLNTETIGRIHIPVPPKDEQIGIVKYLDYEIEKIDKTMEKIQKNITLLEEYKTSLIHHVVTGKIDVRGEEI